jgi:putative Flp pilus-assembly TadE/G-like protein
MEQQRWRVQRDDYADVDLACSIVFRRPARGNFPTDGKLSCNADEFIRVLFCILSSHKNRVIRAAARFCGADLAAREDVLEDSTIMFTAKWAIRVRANRRASVMIYLIITMTVLVGFCAMAVDLTRTEVAKTELQRAADAAARAAVANLYAGNTAAQNAAVAVAAQMSVDGVPVTLTAASDIQFINWTSASSYTVVSNASAANAVRVYARRTTANGNPIPMLFAGILGKPTIDVWASAIAALVTTQSETDWVSANSNPWMAGQPTGTQGSEPDPGYPSTNHKWKYDIAGTYGGTDPSADAYGDPKYEPYSNPMQAGFTVTPGAIITVAVPLNSSNVAENYPTSNPTAYANGDDGGTYANYSDDAASNPNAPGYSGAGNANSASDATGSEHGMSNISTPINSVVGVFLDNSNPSTEGTAPPGLDFSTQTERDYISEDPELRQTFYAGNGETSSGAQQMIVVPPNATRFFLGTMDGHEWSNNSGGYNATITEQVIELVQ